MPAGSLSAAPLTKPGPNIRISLVMEVLFVMRARNTQEVMAVNRVETSVGSEGVRPMWRSVGATAPNGHYRYRATIIIASIKMNVLDITDTMHCTITTRRIFLLVTCTCGT